MPIKFLMPAEWEPHEATWIAWPHNKKHWPENFGPIPGVFAEMVKALAESEKVFICVNNASMEKEARDILKEKKIDTQKNVQFFHIPTNASWSRDHGPIFVRDENKKLLITDWIFNSWGRKYPPWNLDDCVPQKIGKLFNIRVIQTGMVLEGGSIDVNGKGSLLTTEQCLLNKNRNPELSKKQIEEMLKKYLGTTNILWLKEGIIGDDTDGHIDDIARFTDEQTIVCCRDKNRGDGNHEILEKNYGDLKKMRDQNGNFFQIIEIPMPKPVIYENQQLPASYANFYIGNTVVLLPTFRCDEDEKAKNILKKLFPTRKIAPIDCMDLIWGLGAIHCSTQQQPA